MRTRCRLRYACCALLTIATGLLVHRGALPLPPRLRDATGDALWAAMMVCWIGALGPERSPRHRAGLALAICVAVELSQRHHAPWLDALRSTLAGQLVLGSGFDAWDLVAYTAGVAAAMLLDVRWMIASRTGDSRR